MRLKHLQIQPVGKLEHDGAKFWLATVILNAVFNLVFDKVIIRVN